MQKVQEIHIRPNRSWIRFEWRELWEYRDLFWLLVRRDLVTKYKQTVLGPLWFILQPVLTSVVFTIVFGQIAKISTDNIPPYLFYLCGMLAWSYFAVNMTATATAFTSNAHLFGKVYFPRLVLPLSTSVSNLAALGVQMLTFGGFWLFYKFGINAGDRFQLTSTILFLPALLLLMVALSLGVSLWMSSLSAKYRDFAHLMGFLTQLWMYATPVVYPLSQVPEKWRWIIELNPMTLVVEGTRLALLGRGSIGLNTILVAVGVTLFLFVTGVLMFQRTARTFIDTV